jgi:dTDP-4-amino-4,6-dideoxygalactose transaminase
MSDMGTTSFFPSKNLGCFGDGGAIITNNDDLAQICRSVANHGMKVRYYHDHVGINSRLDSVQAAILSIKLKHLDEYNAARQKAAAYYDKAFANCDKIHTPGHDPKSSHIFHQYTLVLQDIDRDELKKYLQNKGIPSMVYYPVPLHLQKAYQYLNYREGDFPITEQLCKSVISIPMHTELDDEELNYITSSFLEFVK